jgi:iron complex transport system substrate-binding protein
MRRLLAVLAVLVWSGAAWAAPERVVSLGGSVTEIVYALGQGDRLVADDESSLYPEDAQKLPRVGYYRTVPLEGIVSMKPDLVLASENAGPPKTLDRLAQLGVQVQRVSDGPSLDSLYQRIEQIAGTLHAEAEGKTLADQIRDELAAAQARQAPARRAVVLVNRTGSFMGAGGHTAADAVLRLAGMENALASQNGYTPVSTEGLATLAPDLIIITSTSLQASGGLDAFKARPDVSVTPAAREGRIAVINDLLILGLGPRVAQAVSQIKDVAR